MVPLGNHKSEFMELTHNAMHELRSGVNRGHLVAIDDNVRKCESTLLMHNVVLEQAGERKVCAPVEGMGPLMNVIKDSLTEVHMWMSPERLDIHEGKQTGCDGNIVPTTSW